MEMSEVETKGTEDGECERRPKHVLDRGLNSGDGSQSMKRAA
jgi:hypothetical protein